MGPFPSSCTDAGCTISDAKSRTVIIKRDASERINTERTLLGRFQGNPFFRPLIDEIEEPKPDDSATIVLKYYDYHIGQIEKGLSSREAKYVGSCVLQALSALHAAGYIHSGSSAPPRTQACCKEFQTNPRDARCETWEHSGQHV